MTTVTSEGVGPAFRVFDGGGPVVSTAVHAGHALRPEVAGRALIDEATRLREEDPFTDRLAVAGTRVVVDRSRFEVDINRDRDHAVYRTPEDAWGLRVWKEPLPPDAIERSLALHDELYGALADRLDALAARGPFVVLDIHSYNHRRDGVPAPPAENPDLNVGTGSLDRRRWAPVVDAFVDEMGARRVAGRALDVRENVRFTGAHLARWVHGRYPDTGCVLALEFKKVFMDEWTGEPDDHHIAELAGAVEVGAARLGQLLTEGAA